MKGILNFYQEKFPHVYNEYKCLTALTYFEDAEKGQQGRKRIYVYSRIGWREIKKFIGQEVKKYQLEQIKK